MDDYSLLSDEELLRRVSRDDRFAEELLASRYALKVKLIARRFFLSGSDNEDLIQEGMLGLISAIRKFNPECDNGFSSFAGTCIKNRIIDYIRTTSNSHESSAEEISEDEKDPGPGPEELFIEQEKYQETLRQFRDRLSSYEYKILVMYLEGMSYSEIAKILKRSQVSIYNAMQRVRIKLTSS